MSLLLNITQNPLQNIKNRTEMADLTRMVLTADQIRRTNTETKTVRLMCELYPNAPFILIAVMVHQLKE